MGSTYGPAESVSAAHAKRGPNQWCGVHRLVARFTLVDDRSPCVRFHDGRTGEAPTENDFPTVMLTIHQEMDQEMSSSLLLLLFAC